MPQQHCHNCGAPLSSGDTFCQNCGTPVLPQSAAARGTRKDNGKLVAIIAIVCSLLVLGGAAFFLINHFRSEEEPSVSNTKKNDKNKNNDDDELSANDYLRLGDRYLRDGDYDEAILAFENAIKIDEKLTEAYLGVADAYVAQGDYDSAISWLSRGYLATGDEQLNEKQQELITATAPPPAPPTAPPAEPVSIIIEQVDTSTFPKISLYITALLENGVPVSDLTGDMLKLRDGVSGDVSPAWAGPASSVPLSVALTLDNSGSMDGLALAQAKESAKLFLSYVDLAGGDKLEIAEFNSGVYVRLPYSGDENLLRAAIDTMGCTGQTALYDAIYMSLVRAYSQSGQKCVLVFTDGMENSSSRTLYEVIELARSTGIPVYIIGVGGSVDEQALRSLAGATGGSYYNSPTAADLEAIYRSVYDKNKDMFRIDYTTSDVSNTEALREVTVVVSGQDYTGEAAKEYIPSVDNSLPLEWLYETVTSSSILNPQKSTLNGDGGATFEYLAYHALDGDNSTIWCEGADGYGLGEWWQVTYVRQVSLSGMYVKNGYWRLEDRLSQNGRIKKMRVTFSDGSSEEFTLTDPVNQRYYDLINSPGEQIVFSQKHITSSIRITILEAYPGTKWEDTCLTDVSVFR